MSQLKVNAMCLGKMIRLLQHHPCTIREVAEHTGLAYITCAEWLLALHKEKAVFIDHWEQDARGREAIKVYALGQGKDAKRRAAASPAERQARLREKEKAQRELAVLAGRGEWKKSRNGKLVFHPLPEQSPTGV